MNPCRFLGASAVALLLSLTASSQCVDIISDSDLVSKGLQSKEVRRIQDELSRIRKDQKWPTDAQIKERNAQWADEDMLEAKLRLAQLPPPAAFKVILDAGKSIKLVVDNDVDSNVNKSEDYVQFSTINHIYGVTPDGKKRCVVIPAQTKVFGVVDYVKGRTPFRLRGKARLYVYVDHIELPDESIIPIRFSEPIGLVPGTGGRTRNDKVVKPCENARNKLCIVGRLSKTTFAPTIIGAGAGGLIPFDDEETSNTAAALSLVRDLGNASGLTEFINQSHAGLKAKQIFEATNTVTRTVRIWNKPDVKPAEAKAPDVKP